MAFIILNTLHLERRSTLASMVAWEYFLSSYLKSLVGTLAHMKNIIRQAVTNIPVDMLERVKRNFQVQLTQCIENNARHLPDKIIILKQCKHTI